MSWFKALPLHRRRGRRRGRNVRVLDERELELLLQAEGQALAELLEQLQWPYHRDAGNRLWATVEIADIERLMANR